MFGTIDTWLIYNLTKENSYVSDVTNASRTMFMNIETFEYDDELFKLWDISPKKISFPKLSPLQNFMVLSPFQTWLSWDIQVL